MSKLSIGRIVRYAPTEQEQLKITGMGCLAAKELPALVVETNGAKANLKVQLNGPGELFVKEVKEGKKPGTWQWPPVTK
ncbi:MAG: hypothetical protein AAF717_00250 [Bacteroidota bacterium]